MISREPTIERLSIARQLLLEPFGRNTAPAVAIAANRLLFAATELSFSTPTDSATRTESVSAVTMPVFVWLCAKP